MQLDAEWILRYDLWANREVLASLRRVGSPQRALRILAHIVAVQGLFLSRATDGSPVVVWPEPDLDRDERELERTHARWCELLRSCASDLQYSYINSKGEAWTSTLADTIAHLATHSAYHRGQIALLLGAAGTQPPYTDLIHAARCGLI